MPVTAQDALRQLAGKNAKTVEQVRDGQRDKSHSVYIFNVGPTHHVVSMGSLGQFFIPACEPGKEYSTPLRLDGMVPEHVPLDMKKLIPRFDDGIEVARDILGVGYGKSASQSLVRQGCFIAAGEKPTKQETTAANKELENHYVRLVQEADDFYAQGPMEIRNISANHREACNKLSLDREWCKTPKQMIPCPGCGDNVSPDVAIHGGRHGCGTVINESKVIALKMVGYEHLWKVQTK